MLNPDTGIKSLPAGEPLASANPYYEGYEAWKGWDRPFSFSEEEAEYFEGEMRGIPFAGKNVLEIGFGQGNFLAWAKLQGAHVTGTELNPVMLQAALQNGTAVLDANLTAAAAQNREHFDTIVAIDVLEHFTREEVDAALHAVDAMLRPGGFLILRFPNGQSPFGLLPQYADFTHRTPLSMDIVEQLCRDTGLTAVRYRGSYRIRGPIGLKRTARWLRGIARDLLGGVLNMVYACKIPWDAVVVLVLRKQK